MSEWFIVSHPNTIWERKHGPYTEQEARGILGKINKWGKYTLLENGKIVDQKHVKAGTTSGITNHSSRIATDTTPRFLRDGDDTDTSNNSRIAAIG